MVERDITQHEYDKSIKQMANLSTVSLSRQMVVTLLAVCL